ncbi:MAG: hypothetical protein AAF721_25470 [Myxococcota bacterium]
MGVAAGLALLACGHDAQSGLTAFGSDGASQPLATESGPASSSEPDLDSGSSEASGGGSQILLDVGAGTGGPGAGDCMESAADSFNTIWIANSPAGQVSKIDTASAVEVARYEVGPDPAHVDPSRTSVNLEGDVAVVNRRGTVVKIAQHLDACIDRDGDGVISTSSGPTDVLPFGDDECVLWEATLDYDYAVDGFKAGPRATAWEPGSGMCGTGLAYLWVGYLDAATKTAHFDRLSGEDGSLDAEVLVPDWIDLGDYGPYGGAVDRDGNFWAVGKVRAPLVKIDRTTLEYERFDHPGGNETFYGIAIGADNAPWISGRNGALFRVDPEDGAWETMAPPGPGGLRGLAIDRDGQAWIAANEPCALVQFDTLTRTLVDASIPLPGCIEPVGVSVDFAGKVWVPDYEADLAVRVDPVSHATEIVTGLRGPYTYSDMTGGGLHLVTFPPAG